MWCPFLDERRNTVTHPIDSRKRINAFEHQLGLKPIFEAVDIDVYLRPEDP